ncbi:MAG TPA: hypothetical protein DCL71_03925 [Bifidobacterium sp.]|nr:hypothetical protein [Bifidobacterium sp.]
MAKNRVSVDFNPKFFDEILNSAGVKALTTLAANRALAYARASAPVDTGAYRDGLGLEEVKRARRTTVMVVGHDPKTLLVEAQTGNLAKALKKAKV